MIFILKRADFSDNNIGKVTLGLHPFTKKVIAKCNRFPKSSDQVLAFDKFVQTLDVAGVLEHLSFLNAPWLSASKEQALYDVVGEYQMADNGFLFSDGSLYSSSALKSTSVKTPIPLKNFFVNVRNKNTTGVPVLSGSNMYMIQTNGSTPFLNDAFNFNIGLGPTGAVNDGKSTVINIEKDSITPTDVSFVKCNGMNTKAVGSPAWSSIGGTFTSYGVYSRDEINICPTIFMAGDGTTLTAEQQSVVLEAAHRLQEKMG